MRLPLRHRPPARAPARQSCAYLEALAEGLIGVPLGPAATAIASPRSRGRHGNAVQWHLGLEPHDAVADLDWEGRIEIKLVSVWRRGDAVACDKLKVCDIAVDPWRKLSNVLFVFADRLTRVVVDAAVFHLRDAALAGLASAWGDDPHFGSPSLFVEAREQQGRSSPAYYLSASWLAGQGLLPPAGPAVLPFDARWWSRCRSEHGRDPLLSVVDDAEELVTCRRCGGPITFDGAALAATGWAPARHGMPLGDACALASHAVVAASRMRPGALASATEFRAGVEGRVARDVVWRVADRVAEPEDHGH